MDLLSKIKRKNVKWFDNLLIFLIEILKVNVVFNFYYIKLFIWDVLDKIIINERQLVDWIPIYIILV